VPDEFFDEMYASAADPWGLASRWYEQRKYAITMAMLPSPGYRHAFEPGCSVGVLTEQLVRRCERVTAIDVAQAALDATTARLAAVSASDRVALHRRSIDEDWPPGDYDLIVLSEVGYYLDEPALRHVLDRECPRLRQGTTVIAAHWRHPVVGYPLTGDEANAVIAQTEGLDPLGRYLDDDVSIAVLVSGTARSVAACTGVPGVRVSSVAAADGGDRDG
jgi:hypothetical protein